MVLSAPAADDAVPPRDADWIEQIGLSLQLSKTRGILIHVDQAVPQRLGDLVRGLVGLHPDLDVHADLRAVETAPEGAVMVLLLRPEHAEALNLGRPVFAHKKLKVVLWCDHETTVALSQEAPDFFDWISEHHDCPPGPVPHAVAGLRCAVEAGAPGVVWRGPGGAAEQARLRGAFKVALPGEKLSWVDPKLHYEKLIEELPAAQNGWIACRVQATSHVRSIRWAMAESKRRGRVIIVGDTYPCPGWWPVDDQLSSFDEARRTLAEMGSPRPGALAALTGLESGAVDLARDLLGKGVEHAELWKLLCAARDPGAALAAKAYEQGLVRVDEVTRRTAPQPVLRALARGESSTSEDTKEPEILVEAALRRGVKSDSWIHLTALALAMGESNTAGVWALRAANKGGRGQQRALRRVVVNLRASGHVVQGQVLELALRRRRTSDGHFPDNAGVVMLVLTLLILGTLQNAKGSERYVHLVMGFLAVGGCLLALAVHWRRTRDDKPKALDERYDVAVQHVRRGAFEEAVRVCDDLFVDTSHLWGYDHLRCRRSVALYAEILLEQMNFEVALTLLKEAVAREGRLMDVHHPSFVELMPMLASALTGTGQARDGERLLRKVLVQAGQVDVLGEAPSHRLEALPSLADSKADEYVQLFLAMPEPPPLSDASRATALRLLAEALLTQGRYDEAEHLLNELAVPQADKTLPSDHPERWRTLTTLGRVLALQRRPERAEPVLRRALALAETHAGARHPDVARVLAELARVEHRLGRPEAPATARRALDLYVTAQVADAEKILVRGELESIVGTLER